MININITGFLQHQAKLVVALVGICMLALVIGAQFQARWELSFSVFYLLPVSYFAWFFSRSAGILTSLMSAAASLATTLAHRPFYLPVSFAYWNSVLNLILFLAIVHIMRELKELYLKEQQQSHRDSLTGIANRRSFLETLSAEIERAKRYQFVTTMAYVDADNFKHVNDSLGHDAGDELLAAVATVIRNNLRNIDTVARLGGDEFCILMPHTDAAAAGIVLTKIWELLNREMTQHGWPVTFSVGVVTYLKSPGSVTEALRAADHAMYSAKMDGKNQIKRVSYPA